MKLLQPILILVLTFAISSTVQAKRTEVTILLSEQFFDTVIDAMFLHSQSPKFSIAAGTSSFSSPLRSDAIFRAISHTAEDHNTASRCDESIRLLRETGGVRTAVRFREGQIQTPLSFTGNYNPPLVGCVEFSGWAETNIDLRFAESEQRLVAIARVNTVNLNGTGGVGGNLIARMVQSSIDKRVNPIEIMQLDKISFLLPMQNAGGIRMKAVGVRHTVMDHILAVHIAYEFDKAS